MFHRVSPIFYRGFLIYGEPSPPLTAWRIGPYVMGYLTSDEIYGPTEHRLTHKEALDHGL